MRVCLRDLSTRLYAFGEGLLLARVTVFVCIFNLYISTIDIPVYNFIAASGMFKIDKYISIAGSGMNLTQPLLPSVGAWE